GLGVRPLHILRRPPFSGRGDRQPRIVLSTRRFDTLVSLAGGKEGLYQRAPGDDHWRRIAELSNFWKEQFQYLELRLSVPRQHIRSAGWAFQGRTFLRDLGRGCAFGCDVGRLSSVSREGYCPRSLTSRPLIAASCAPGRQAIASGSICKRA